MLGRSDCGNADYGKPTYNFTRADFLNLYLDYANCNWACLLEAQDLNVAVQLFYDKVYSILNMHVPPRNAVCHKHPPWFSHDLKRLLKKKDKLRKRWKKHQMPHLHEQFKRLRSEIKL